MRLPRSFAPVLLAGLAAIGVAPAAADVRGIDASRIAPAGPYTAYTAEAAQRFGIPRAWIDAVLDMESGGDVGAVSSAGAMGLMQVMPDTWAMLRVRHRLGDDPFDPRANILAGTAYLREMHDRYGDIAAMLAAYNAGPSRYDEYLVSGRILPSETRAYVALLAPALGGAPLPDAGTTPPRPADWREAPLFVGGMTTGPGAAQPPADRMPDETADLSAVRGGTVAPSPAQELFVVRSAGGPAP